MNIQLLTQKFISNRGNAQNLNSNVNSLNFRKASYPNLQPLQKDTVSFTGKVNLVEDISREASKVAHTKVLDEWDPRALPFQDIIEICNSFKKPLDKFTRDLREVMKDLVCTEAKPNNIIMPGNRGIKSRVKDANKVAEKANSRKLFTVEEVEGMGDVGGARIVLRSASSEDMAQLFDRLGALVKKGYKVKEVENWRLEPKFSYVNQSTLDDFEALCQRYNHYPQIKNRARENGYTAIHISFELSDGKVIELQIMGRDMEKVKDIEDFYYKRVSCEKKLLDPKYKVIQDLIDEKVEALSDVERKALDEYVRNAYLHARSKEASPSKRRTKPEKEFYQFPDFLPKELSYVNIQRLKEACDAAAQKAKNAKQFGQQDDVDITRALIVRPKQ